MVKINGIFMGIKGNILTWVINLKRETKNFHNQKEVKWKEICI
jgi:hypothetical protein